MILGREENRGISLQQGPEEANNILRITQNEAAKDFPKSIFFGGMKDFYLSVA